MDENLKFIPNFKGDYNIIRQCSHDGTLLFTRDLLLRTLEPIINKQSYCKKDFQDRPNYKDIKYTIGWLKLVSVAGQVNLPCGNQYGIKERTRLSVKCEYFN